MVYYWLRTKTHTCLFYSVPSCFPALWRSTYRHWETLYGGTPGKTTALHRRPNCKTACYLALFLATESQTGSHLGPVTQRHFPLLFLRRLCEGSQRRPCVAQHLLLLVLLLAHPLGLHDLIVALVTFPMPALSLLDRFHQPAGEDKLIILAEQCWNLSCCFISDNWKHSLYFLYFFLMNFYEFWTTVKCLDTILGKKDGWNCFA